MENKGRILLVDDDESICSVASIILKKEGYDVLSTTSASEGVTRFKESFSSDKSFDIIIQDVRMPEISGLDLIRHFQEIDPQVIILVITAFSNYQVATEAMRRGAYDYIKKPFDNELDLKPAVKRAMQSRRLRRKLEGSERDYRMKIIGATPEMKAIYNLVSRVAPTNSTVLIEGESGTGKELIARSIHFQSTRVFEPFLTVNCGAFSEHLLESEMFGHVKGSFTNAFSDKKGLLEVADKGTFFLDEVSELSPTLQVKLLRAIEAREFMPVGSTETRKVDIRFIAATNTDLEDQVRKGKFREDLYYRLNVIFVRMPPLRERKDDIPLLSGYFLDKYNKIMGKEVKEFSPETMELLMSRSWPGNVRELENVIQRAVALSEENIIRLADLAMGGRAEKARQAVQPAGERSQTKAVAPESVIEMVLPPDFNLDSKVEEMEKKYIKIAMDQGKWNQTIAAKLLGINLRALRYKIKKYNID